MKCICLDENELGLVNEDIAIDILSRLPMKTLIGLRCVSKGWRDLISDPAFAAAYVKRTVPISGLFFQERFMLCDDDIERHSYVQFGVQGTRVHQMVLDFVPEKVVLLGTSNGLLCCRSCLPSLTPCIYICNPLIEDFVRVPWNAPSKRDCIALAFDPVSPDLKKTSLSFKLVMVRVVEDFETDDAYFTFHIYSSESRVWVMLKEICHCEYILVNNRSTFAGGSLYWMTEGDEVVMFDVENELSCLISLPLPTTEETIIDKCIGESDGKLHCVTVSQDGVLVWVLKDNFESQWVLTWAISLKKMEEENSQYLCNLTTRVELQTRDAFSPWMKPLAFKDGLLVLIVSLDLYSYDIREEKMKTLCSLAELGKNSMMGPTVLPYSLSLVPASRP